jgi:hypothetical protein
MESEMRENHQVLEGPSFNPSGALGPKQIRRAGEGLGLHRLTNQSR